MIALFLHCCSHYKVAQVEQLLSLFKLGFFFVDFDCCKLNSYHINVWVCVLYILICETNLLIYCLLSFSLSHVVGLAYSRRRENGSQKCLVENQVPYLCIHCSVVQYIFCLFIDGQSNFLASKSFPSQIDIKCADADLFIICLFRFLSPNCVWNLQFKHIISASFYNIVIFFFRRKHYKRQINKAL